MLNNAMEQSSDPSSSLPIHVNTASYCTLVCHALKNSSTSVMGALLGTVATDHITCESVLPLLHSQVINAPLLSFGFSMAEALAQKKRLSIVGVYFGNYDNSLHRQPYQQRIISRLVAKGIKHPIVLMIDTQYVSSLQCCVFSMKNAVSSPVILDSDTPAELDKKIQAGEHSSLHDLLDHTHKITQIPLHD